MTVLDQEFSLDIHFCQAKQLVKIGAEILGIWKSITNIGVTFLGKTGLSFHIEFFYLDVVLLKVEREMWKSADFGKICGF